jgi:hypothetical protein
MSLPQTTLLASVLALILVALSLRVLRLRVRLRQPLGDGGHVVLQRAVRAQGNFAEYVPLALLLCLLMEWQAVPAGWLQTYAVLLVLARVVHALGVSQLREALVWRIVGTAITLLLLGGAAAVLLLRLLAA